jgi:hypothetical protein
MPHSISTGRELSLHESSLTTVGVSEYRQCAFVDVTTAAEGELYIAWSRWSSS